MVNLTYETIRNEIADSTQIFYRGERIYENDELMFMEEEEKGFYRFRYDGNYGEYTISLDFNDRSMPYLCDCPYPGEGCKHIVGALLTVLDMDFDPVDMAILPEGQFEDEIEPEHLTYEEIKRQALEDRKKRAGSEAFTVVEGDMVKDEHLLITSKGKQYTVVMHDPLNGHGHCSCPDYSTNRLGICKHLIFLKDYFKRQEGVEQRIGKEVFPFADIYWESVNQAVKLYYDAKGLDDPETEGLLLEYFTKDGVYTGDNPGLMVELFRRAEGNKKIRIQPEVLRYVERQLMRQKFKQVEQDYRLDLSSIQAELYPYQKTGVEFGLFRPSVLIGDEMGLGKTIQAIALCILKKELFGFRNVLVITLASLKDQWDREIRKFTSEEPVVVAGNAKARRRIYKTSRQYFKITNYEAVLRDVTIISEMKPDIIVLDEAQRIKNFNTKTADAVKCLPRQHAIVLTGTPLENKLEDVYSIVQFLDRDLLSPLWEFAAKHFMMLRKPKGKIAGYTGLSDLREKLGDLVIRRRKDEVLKDLPETVTNNYFVDMTDEQEKMHAGYLSSLLPILGKKFLTPLDLQRMQRLLLMMRMVSDSTYLVDKKTHLSPKLKEFEYIIQDLAVENKRKVVVFSEWTTMTFLIAKCLSKAKIPFVELSGKIPVNKRQNLIDEFTHNPDCRVFLSTDAGGTGLNLQAADCVINFELPWNPAKLSQRTGRVNRIGQTSTCINVINLISKRSIEMKILTGLEMKKDLFKGVFEDGDDTVDFSNEKRVSLLNRLREMMGEEPDEVARSEQVASEEIPQDTPHFLNPLALADEDETLEESVDKAESVFDFAAEESGMVMGDDGQGSPSTPDDLEVRENVFEDQPAEKIEAVLNSGMEFIGGLLEMATGKKIEKSDTQDKMLSIDRQTGEVTMKFKLPGF